MAVTDEQWRDLIRQLTGFYALAVACIAVIAVLAIILLFVAAS